MHKAMRQMLEQSGREGVARGEASSIPSATKPAGPPFERQDTGLTESKAGTGALLEAKSRTSNSRTTQCGPACRVVWQGDSR